MIFEDCWNNLLQLHKKLEMIKTLKYYLTIMQYLKMQKNIGIS